MVKEKYKKIMEYVELGKLKVSKVIVTSQDENGIWRSKVESEGDI